MQRVSILSTAALLWTATAPWLPVDVAEAAGPGVHGRVFEASDEGRVLGLVPNATVEFFGESGESAATARSNAQGYYQADLTPGRYYFRVTAEGFRKEDAGRGFLLNRSAGYVVQNFSLRSGESPDDARPPERPTTPLGLLAGDVSEETPDGTRKPIPGARITLRQEGQVKTRTVVAREHPGGGSAAGDFQVRLPKGVWRAAVAAPRFQRLVDPTPIEITDGATTRRSFVLKRLAPEPPANQGIRGSVVVAGGGSLESSSEVQLLIRCLKTRGPYPRRIRLATPDKFSQDLPSGQYRLAARAKGYQTAFSHTLSVFDGRYTRVRLALKPLEPAPGTVAGGPTGSTPTPVPDPTPTPTPTPEPTPTPPPATVTVTVLADSETGSPIPDATVVLRTDGGTTSRATTNADGKAGWRLKEIAEPLSATILARKEGFIADGARQQLQPGSDHELTVVLRTTTPTPVPVDPERETPDPGSPPPIPQPSTLAFTSYVVYKTPSRVHGIPGTRVRFQRVLGGRGSNERLREIDLNGDGILSQAERDAALRVEEGWTAVSGELGLVSVELPVGTYRVTTEPPSDYRGTEQTFEVRPGVTSDYIYVVRTAPPPPPLSELAVLVTEQDSQTGATIGFARLGPSSGATVRVVDKIGKVSLSQQTGADGRTAFKLPRGSYRVEASKNGYAAAVETAAVEGPRAELTLSLRAMPDQPPETPPTQRGLWLVVHDAASRQQLLLNAKIDVSASGRLFPIRLDSAIRAFHADVPPGVYTVRVAHAGYEVEDRVLRVREGAPTTLYVGLRKVQPDGPPLPPPKSPVEIHVRVDYGGEFGSGPLAGAMVIITQGGKTVERGVTGNDGVFRTALPPKATYQLQVTGDPRRRLDRANETFTLGLSHETTITLRPIASTVPGGSTPTTPPPVAPKLSPVEIHVRVDYGGEFGKAPLENATVIITREGKTAARGVTGKDGVYRTSLEPKATYTFLVAADPKLRLTQESQSFTLGSSYQMGVVLRRSNWTTPGQTPDGAPGGGTPGGTTPSRPPPSAPVEIRALVDYGGEFGAGPLAGANVVITRNGKTVAQGIAGGDGVYRVNLPPNATYQVRVTADPKRRLDSATRTFMLRTSYKIAITLRPTRSVPSDGSQTPTPGTPVPATPPPAVPFELRVLVDYGGEFGSGPLAGATVTITSQGKTVAQGVTRNDGMFRASLPSKTAYQLRVTGPANQRLSPVTQSFSLNQSYQTSVTLRRSR